MLWKSIDVLEARETLKEMNIASWPHMKQQARSSLHKKISKKAFPKLFEDEKPMTLDRLEEILRGRR